MSLYHQELEDFKIAGTATISMFFLLNTTNFSMGSQLKEMLKGALRRISTMKTVTLGKVDKVESEASSP